MPYIKESDRVKLLERDNQHPETAGELNYLVTLLCLQYYKFKAPSYQRINDIVGALEGAKMEFTRRITNDYENIKIKENGDVY